MKTMGLDIRWPISIIFTLYGAMLIVFGLFSDPALYAKSLGVNINLWWGGAMVAFGLFMGALALRARRRQGGA